MQNFHIRNKRLHFFLHRESLEFLNQDDEPKQKRARTEEVSGMDHGISDDDDDNDDDDDDDVFHT